MEILAIIPARGGSKGIPRKNVQLLAGKPLIAWTIEAAKNTKSVSRVVVSTDDAEIESVSREYGAEVVKRPAGLATDTASSESALLHVLEHVEKAEGYKPDILVFLQCTSPFTLPEDIEGTIAVLGTDSMDCTFTVTPFHGFLWSWNEGKEARGINHDMKVRPMRQEMQHQFIETGAVYAMRVEGFKKARHRFFGRIGRYVVPGERSLDINTAIDFAIAEMLVTRKLEEKGDA